MNNNTTKSISLPELAIDKVNDFANIAGLYSRDELANQIALDIDEACKQLYSDTEMRSHLGASQIGHECSRYIWYAFRWMCKLEPTPNMLRIWQRGHIEENRVIDLLRQIGFEIQQTNSDGKQFQIARDEANGHFGGSCDSLIKLPTRYGQFPDWFLLEIKTANKNGYAPINNSGVQKGNDRYWKQMCIYGYKFGIEYCLFVCVGKNDDDLSFEFLQLDLELGKAECVKAEFIVNSFYPPKKISENASYFLCGNYKCPALSICHMGATPLKNCRSCRFAQPIANGEWMCHNYNAVIPKQEIPNGCERWEPIG